MKKVIFSWLVSMVLLTTTASAQYGGTDRTGYDGDYFSLEGAIELFKQSRSINDFERKLNSEDTWVNNLDLDWDGRIDYIRVEHRRQGNFHAIVLQVALGRYDVQDVAVIEIEKTGRREAVLQIVGDEDLYGEEVIVEPYEGYAYNGSGYHSNYNSSYVNVYYWPAVQDIFGYNYKVYVSPYRWQYYPTWWSPWHPYAWNVYRPRIVIYHQHYHVARVHRVIHVHNFYKPHRVYSHNVLDRTNNVRVKHGKAPVKRAAVVQNNNRNDIQKENNVVKQSRVNTPNRQADNVKKAEPRVPDTNRNATPKVTKEQERKTTTRPETNRVTEPAKPSVDNKKATPAIKNDPGKSAAVKKNTPTPAPKARTQSKPATSSPGVDRSGQKTTRKPATSVQKQAPATNNKAVKNTPAKSSSAKSKRGQ